MLAEADQGHDDSTDGATTRGRNTSRSAIAGAAGEAQAAHAAHGRGQTTDGKHPGLRAVLTQGAGQANMRKVAVKLPLSLALDPDNSQSDALCEFEAGKRVDCPAASIIGHARAYTPVLNRPLEGPVYFVKNVRVHPRRVA